jgi:DNA topoisomerase IB
MALRDLPGQELFQYLDADGTRHVVDSSDVNDYLREATGAEFTAKDYRTWAGSVFALAALRKLEWATVIAGARATGQHHQGGLATAAQYARRLPQVLRASGHYRGIRGR